MSFGRRHVLRAGLVVLPLAAIAGTTAACTEEPAKPPPPDPLAALAARARTDAETATAVAAAQPGLTAAATEVATARGEHATALQQEVDRERPPVSSSAAPPSSPPSSPPAAPPPDPVAARSALLEALTAAEREAGKLVPSVPRYRAGLVGSVAAGCASLREVLA
ncbi:MAG: hypothetical protein GEV28_33850 [Actinophytocola sp.]|uniref:hypothetical protein n=1 Tax=Actinophytocola sp. TaxID=1872138 RepID=UPI00132221D5|nr:hypothetical protein [Actinophytocola sp.]MPZ85104.1 hypothetical protein [Actinophytocola sp.]